MRQLRGGLGNALRKVRKASMLLGEPTYRKGLRHGVAAAIEHAALLRTLDCVTVIDIGANVGQFALATRVALPLAKVIAFEPLESPALRFRELFRDDPNVVLHEFAIGPQAMQVAMHVSTRIDSSSLLPIGYEQTQMFPGTHEVRTERVAVTPLSSLVQPATIVAPALLKIDVQGFELEALQGCADCIDRFDYVYVECSFIELYERQALADEVLLYLRGHGFWLRGIHNPTYKDGRCVQADFFLARASRRARRLE